MERVLGKTLYVLGAGASVHTGAPLLSNFLVKARLLREGKSPLTHKESFDNVFDWIESLRGSSYYIEFDLDNLEQIFSLAEMARQTDLKWLVMETLDRCRLHYDGQKFQPDSVYREFVSSLVKLNRERVGELGQIEDSNTRDVIVSFNYDVMLDYAIQFHGLTPEYFLSPAGQKDVRLLKLHGSTNWARCVACEKDRETDFLQVVPPRINPAGSTEPKPSEATMVDFRMVTSVLAKTPCNHCKQKGTLEPVVISPTWSKLVEKTPLAEVWKSAVDAMRDAYQIVVIGYSMPQTDTFFQYLLTLGLSNNQKLHRVVVVNTDSSDAFRARYKRVFSRSLDDRGQLLFVKDKDFRRFVSPRHTEDKTQSMSSLVPFV